MQLRGNVTLILLLVVITQICLTHCMPRSRSASLKSYFGSIKDAKVYKAHSTFLPTKRSNSNAFLIIGKNAKIVDNDSLQKSMYRMFDFPDIEYPLDNSPRNPFYFETNINSNNFENGRNVASDIKYNKEINDFKKELRMHCKIDMINNNKDYFIKGEMPSFPKHLSITDPIWLKNSETFPEVQYPLNVMETWMPTYWNPWLFTEDEKHNLLMSSVLESSKKNKRTNQSYKQPFKFETRDFKEEIEGIIEKLKNSTNTTSRVDDIHAELNFINNYEHSLHSDLTVTNITLDAVDTFSSTEKNVSKATGSNIQVYNTSANISLPRDYNLREEITSLYTPNATPIIRTNEPVFDNKQIELDVQSKKLIPIPYRVQSDVCPAFNNTKYENIKTENTRVTNYTLFKNEENMSVNQSQKLLSILPTHCTLSADIDKLENLIEILKTNSTFIDISIKDNMTEKAKVLNVTEPSKNIKAQAPIGNYSDDDSPWKVKIPLPLVDEITMDYHSSKNASKGSSRSIIIVPVNNVLQTIKLPVSVKSDKDMSLLILVPNSDNSIVPQKYTVTPTSTDNFEVSFITQPTSSETQTTNNYNSKQQSYDFEMLPNNSIHTFTDNMFALKGNSYLDTQQTRLFVNDTVFHTSGMIADTRPLISVPIEDAVLFNDVNISSLQVECTMLSNLSTSITETQQIVPNISKDLLLTNISLIDINIPKHNDCVNSSIINNNTNYELPSQITNVLLPNAISDLYIFSPIENILSIAEEGNIDIRAISTSKINGALNLDKIQPEDPSCDRNQILMLLNESPNVGKENLTKSVNNIESGNIANLKPGVAFLSENLNSTRDNLSTFTDKNKSTQKNLNITRDNFIITVNKQNPLVSLDEILQKYAGNEQTTNNYLQDYEIQPNYVDQIVPKNELSSLQNVLPKDNLALLADETLQQTNHSSINKDLHGIQEAYIDKKVPQMIVESLCSDSLPVEITKSNKVSIVQKKYPSNESIDHILPISNKHSNNFPSNMNRDVKLLPHNELPDLNYGIVYNPYQKIANETIQKSLVQNVERDEKIWCPTKHDITPPNIKDIYKRLRYETKDYLPIVTNKVLQKTLANNFAKILLSKVLRDTSISNINNNSMWLITELTHPNYVQSTIKGSSNNSYYCKDKDETLKLMNKFSNIDQVLPVNMSLSEIKPTMEIYNDKVQIHEQHLETSNNSILTLGSPEDLLIKENIHDILTGNCDKRSKPVMLNSHYPHHLIHDTKESSNKDLFASKNKIYPHDLTFDITRDTITLPLKTSSNYLPPTNIKEIETGQHISISDPNKDQTLLNSIHTKKLSLEQENRYLAFPLDTKLTENTLNMQYQISRMPNENTSNIHYFHEDHSVLLTDKISEQMTNITENLRLNKDFQNVSTKDVNDSRPNTSFKFSDLSYPQTAVKRNKNNKPIYMIDENKSQLAQEKNIYLDNLHPFIKSNNTFPDRTINIVDTIISENTSNTQRDIKLLDPQVVNIIQNNISSSSGYKEHIQQTNITKGTLPLSETYHQILVTDINPKYNNMSNLQQNLDYLKSNSSPPLYTNNLSTNNIENKSIHISTYQLPVDDLNLTKIGTQLTSHQFSDDSVTFIDKRDLPMVVHNFLPEYAPSLNHRYKNINYIDSQITDNKAKNLLIMQNALNSDKLKLAVSHSNTTQYIPTPLTNYSQVLYKNNIHPLLPVKHISFESQMKNDKLITNIDKPPLQIFRNSPTYNNNKNIDEPIFVNLHKLSSDIDRSSLSEVSNVSSALVIDNTKDTLSLLVDKIAKRSDTKKPNQNFSLTAKSELENDFFHLTNDIAIAPRTVEVRDTAITDTNISNISLSDYLTTNIISTISEPADLIINLGEMATEDLNTDQEDKHFDTNTSTELLQEHKFNLLINTKEFDIRSYKAPEQPDAPEMSTNFSNDNIPMGNNDPIKQAEQLVNSKKLIESDKLQVKQLLNTDDSMVLIPNTKSELENDFFHLTNDIAIAPRTMEVRDTAVTDTNITNISSSDYLTTNIISTISAPADLIINLGQMATEDLNTDQEDKHFDTNTNTELLQEHKFNSLINTKEFDTRSYKSPEQSDVPEMSTNFSNDNMATGNNDPIKQAEQSMNSKKFIKSDKLQVKQLLNTDDSMVLIPNIILLNIITKSKEHLMKTALNDNTNIRVNDLLLVKSRYRNIKDSAYTVKAPENTSIFEDAANALDSVSAIQESSAQDNGKKSKGYSHLIKYLYASV